MTSILPETFCGQVVNKGQLFEINSIMDSPPKLSLKKWQVHRPNRVQTRSKQLCWYNDLNRHHFLAFFFSFCSQFLDFINSKINPIRLGWRQLFRLAWLMLARVRLIECINKEGKKDNSLLVIKNPRILFLLRGTEKHLASAVLSLMAKTAPADWRGASGCLEKSTDSS